MSPSSLGALPRPHGHWVHSPSVWSVVCSAIRAHRDGAPSERFDSGIEYQAHIALASFSQPDYL